MLAVAGNSSPWYSIKLEFLKVPPAKVEQVLTLPQVDVDDHCVPKADGQDALCASVHNCFTTLPTGLPSCGQQPAAAGSSAGWRAATRAAFKA